MVADTSRRRRVCGLARFLGGGSERRVERLGDGLRKQEAVVRDSLADAGNRQRHDRAEHDHQQDEPLEQYGIDPAAEGSAWHGGLSGR